MKNQVQLCTYIDRLGCGNIDSLHSILTTELAGLFGGVHLLPFYYPYDGADAGFDPIDHCSVDSRLGDWQKLARIGNDFDIMADMIVNHMSCESEQFKDFLLHGEKSKYSQLFLSYDTVFPKGASEKELLNLYRPRPGLPFSKVKTADGQHRLMWTTFTSDQIDINVNSLAGKSYLDQVLNSLHSGGVNILRLDATGYAVKKAGTSCFMIDETFAFIDDLTHKAKKMGIEVLVEIHSHFSTQVAIAKRASYVYDFALPPLVLHALHSGKAGPLQEWFQQSPRNCITVLDTHDGIGIIDVAPQSGKEGLLNEEEINELVESIHNASENKSRLATGAAASNVDLYQVNCTFYEALGRDDNKYLLARLIQFFSPGIPQVYYAGLLAADNDMELLARTRVGRDINRPYIESNMLSRLLDKPVVKNLSELIRFRNLHPAFQQNNFYCKLISESSLFIGWGGDSNELKVVIDCSELSFAIRSTLDNQVVELKQWQDLAIFNQQCLQEHKS
jgi:sucrose phosphorylase